ncbi:hypothetical protein GTA08_BOTSDO11121 [Neofusicoccum parvum]|nr:hypothetical protein GTA08_BOTSDO11121 [Neofusicoccum parvum]
MPPSSPPPFAPAPLPGTPQQHHRPPTSPHSEDPEVATPHEGPYPSHDASSADAKPPESSSLSPAPPPPLSTPSLRADWLAARAPEYYQRPPPAGPPAEGWCYGREGEGGKKEQQRVCGLRPWAFWVVIFAIVLVLGGAIGGGVGGGLAAAGAARESSSNPSSTSSFSSTTTLSSSASPTSTSQDSINCPSRTGTSYTTTNGSLTFLQLCGINICPETCDIVSAKQRQDTFEGCMDACAIYNRQVGTQKCVAVAWDYQQVRQSFDNWCWLKLSQAPLVKDDPADGLTVGAVVVQS